MKNLIPDRECGECTICCVNLRIEETDLKKLAGMPCEHLLSKKGCGIYSQRPEVCRNWYCAWRIMPQLDDEWRPDKSSILLRLTEDGIIFEPLKNPHEVLTSRQSIGIIGGGIESNLSIYISIPKESGFCNSLVKLNDQLKPIIATRDGDAVVGELNKLIDFALNQKTDAVLPIGL